MNVKSKGIVRMAALLMMLLLSIGLTAACQPSEASVSRTNEQTVFYDGQNFARRGDKVFIVAGETLYVMNLDGTGQAALTGECDAIAGVTDKYVLYYDANQGAACRIDRCGANRKTLAEGNTHNTPLIGCTDKWVYYSYDDKTLLRVSIDGKQTEQFPNMYSWPINMSITGDSMLLINNGALYYFQDSKSQPVKLLDGSVKHVCRYQDTVFAAGDDGVIKCSLTDKSMQKLADGPADYVQADADRVYYINMNTKNLCSITVDGTGPVLLAQTIGMYAWGKYYVDNGWVYYLRDDVKLYRVSSDGTKTKQLTDTQVELIDVTNGIITYCNGVYHAGQDGGMTPEPIIRKMNADGSNARQFQLPQNGWFISIDDFLYVSKHTEAKPTEMEYKANKDGTDPKQLASAEAAEADIIINRSKSFGSLMFYMKPNCNGIYCSNVDGSDEFQISKQGGGNFVYADGWLYFSNDNGIWRTNRDMNGECQFIVTENYPNVSLCGSRLFYKQFTNIASGSGIWSVNVDGSDCIQLLDSNVNLVVVGVDNEWVYYYDDTNKVSINKMKWDGGAKETLISKPDMGMNEPMYSDGYLYYGCGGTPGRFYRVNCATGEEQLICNMFATDFQFDSNYVYFYNRQGLWRANKKDLKYDCIASGAITGYKLLNNPVFYRVEEKQNDVGIGIDVIKFQ